nr:MtrB/PioB family outer membrane beta-barrel protein [Methylomarinum sp. Ch1-1]MDP4522491.1 MtrB/PioB family outer membrane beta-barrel protein [Methylomarinum sp. Ch1-1]
MYYEDVIPDPIFLTGLCLSTEAIADDEDSMDFSLGALPVEQAPKPIESVYVNEVELGGLYGSEDSFKFGEYSGLQNRGGYVTGNLKLQRRADPNGESTDYWKLDARNLGLTSRYIRGEYGRQGSGKVFLNTIKRRITAGTMRKHRLSPAAIRLTCLPAG